MNREKSPGSTTSPSTKLQNRTTYDPSKNNSNNTLPILKRSKTNVSQNPKIDSPKSISKKSIDLDKSSSSIHEKKNNYILNYLMSKENTSKISVKYMKRNDNKKKTSNSSFHSTNDMKKVLDRKVQYKNNQTANKIISSSMSPEKNLSYIPSDLRLELCPATKMTPSAMQLKLELSPTKTTNAPPVDLKINFELEDNQDNGKVETKIDQLLMPIVPDHRKFSILDIPAYFPENKVELTNRSKAYFLLATSG